MDMRPKPPKTFEMNDSYPRLYESGLAGVCKILATFSENDLPLSSPFRFPDRHCGISLSTANRDEGDEAALLTNPVLYCSVDEVISGNGLFGNSGDGPPLFHALGFLLGGLQLLSVVLQEPKQLLQATYVCNAQCRECISCNKRASPCGCADSGAVGTAQRSPLSCPTLHPLSDLRGGHLLWIRQRGVSQGGY